MEKVDFVLQSDCNISV